MFFEIEAVKNLFIKNSINEGQKFGSCQKVFGVSFELYQSSVQLFNVFEIYFVFQRSLLLLVDKEITAVRPAYLVYILEEFIVSLKFFKFWP